MKKIWSRLISLLIFITSFGFYPSVASANESKSGAEIQHKKSFVTCSGIDCVSDINVSEPILCEENKNGTKTYKKKIDIKNEFFLSENNEHISGNFLSFYFVYNNKSAILDEKGLMKKKIYNFNNYWKIVDNEEIYTSEEQCIVSQIVSMYKRDSSLHNLENVDEFHIDAICSSTGEVIFNIKSTDTAKKEEKKISEPLVNTVKIKKKLFREVFEKNIEYISDLNSNTVDRYRYITRNIHVIYKDNKGNLLADTVLQATFRYNIGTREVQCLSTSNKEKNEKIDVLMRKCNETRVYGGAYAKIKVKKVKNKNKKNYKESIIIKCDSEGKITTQFVD